MTVLFHLFHLLHLAQPTTESRRSEARPATVGESRAQYACLLSRQARAFALHLPEPSGEWWVAGRRERPFATRATYARRSPAALRVGSGCKAARFSLSRALDRRDITVPTGISSVAATSS